MEKKVLAFAMVMSMGVSAFAQEIVTDSTATDSVSVEMAFYEPADTVVADSTLALYEPTDSTATDSTKTCGAKTELARVDIKKCNGAVYDKAVAARKAGMFAAILKREYEMA